VGLDEVQPLEPVERAVHVGNLRQLGELLAADRCASEEAQHEKQVLLVGRKRGLDALDDRGVRIVGLDVGSRSFSGFWVSRAYAASSRILSGFPRSLTLIVSATACSSTVSWRPSSFDERERVGKLEPTERQRLVLGRNRIAGSDDEAAVRNFAEEVRLADRRRRGSRSLSARRPPARGLLRARGRHGLGTGGDGSSPGAEVHVDAAVAAGPASRRSRRSPGRP
jgi:hypothetical protein